jgi:hypothetical protein
VALGTRVELFFIRCSPAQAERTSPAASNSATIVFLMAVVPLRNSMAAAEMNVAGV